MKFRKSREILELAILRAPDKSRFVSNFMQSVRRLYSEAGSSLYVRGEMRSVRESEILHGRSLLHPDRLHLLAHDASRLHDHPLHGRLPLETDHGAVSAASRVALRRLRHLRLYGGDAESVRILRDHLLRRAALQPGEFVEIE